jgi:hypothetical protein
MKKLSREAFDRARNHIKARARPLDRALFEYRFEEASADLVTDELARFQNDDGGFGHALEPDLRTPTSSALATELGLRTLEELGCGSDHPMVADAVRFLLETIDSQVSSLIKSYRAKSHKVVSVKLLHSIISRQASLEKGKAS